MNLNSNTIGAILNSNPDGLVWLDERLRIVYFNRAAEGLFGLLQSEALGRNFLDLCTPQDHLLNAIFIETLHKPFGLSKRASGFDVFCKRQNQTEFAARLTAAQVSADGQYYYTLTIQPSQAASDPQSAPQPENILQIFQSLFDSIHDFIFVFDQQGRILRVNRQVFEWLGYTETELLGAQVSQMYPPELRERAEQIISDLQNGLLTSARLPLMTQDGRELLVETFFEAATWNNNPVWVGISRDITEREKVRWALVNSENRYFQMVTLNHVMMLLVDPDSGQIVDANLAASDFYGYSVAQLCQMNIGQINRLDQSQIEDEMKAALAERRSHFIFPHRLATGDIRTVEVHSTPYIHNNKKILFSIIHDISERVEMEADLSKSRLQLELALEGSQVGLWDWMIQTGGVVFNERWAEIIGFKLAELEPVSIDTWTSKCHPDDLVVSGDLLQRHFSGELPFYEAKVRMLHKSGQWVWVLDRGRVTERDAQGQPVRMIGTHQDITEQVETEAKLKFRSGFEDLLTRISTRFINLSSEEVDAAINTGLQEIGLFEKVDRSYIFLVDYAHQTINNTHEWCAAGIDPQIDLLQNLPFETLPWWMGKIMRHETIVIPAVAEMPLEASTEKAILEMQGIQSVIVLPLFADNYLLGFVGFDAVSEPRSWDQEHIALLHQFGNIISSSLKRKWAERAMLLSEARYKAVLDVIPDNVFRIGSDYVIRDYFSPDVTNLVIPVEKIRGASLGSFLTADTLTLAQKNIDQALVSGQKQTFEYQMAIGNHTDYFEARIIACGADEVIAIIRNVSERARLEEMKSDFINRAVHDLRTPLTTIILMARLLDGECTPEEQREYWAVLKSELERERVLIQDLLTVGQMESNRWIVKASRVDPLDALVSSMQGIMPQAVEKEIEMKLIEPGERFEIMADNVSLQQVFSNLLSNAVKFTPRHGHITVICARQQDKISIQILDTGFGIAPEDLPIMFTRFFRGRYAVEQEIPGNGLGLYIVKSIVEHFAGQITVESVVGKGSLFEIHFPLILQPEKIAV